MIDGQDVNHGTLRVRVVRKAIEVLGICSFELHAEDGNPLPMFSAGSHIDVHLPNGLIRQYSLCNDPAETHRYRIAVLKDPATRGGSAAMHEKVREGDLIHISHPRNHFPLIGAARHSVLLAGGIGITPILSMAERLWSDAASFDLHYYTRSRERTAFYDRIRRSRFASRVWFHVDHSGGAPSLSQLLASQPDSTHLYVCGPRGFIDAALYAARAAGWREERLHREFFGPGAPRAEIGAAFDVVIASSGRVIQVPEGTSVVRALADAGVEIPVSCRQGVCGTCATRILEGEPEHRDVYFTAEEHARNDQFTPCCSRARSRRLVLDL